MNFYRSLNGMIRVSLTSGDPAQALSDVNQAGITVYDTAMDSDGITVCFLLRRQDLKTVKVLAKRKGYRLKVTGRVGLHWTVKDLLKRPVLAIGAVVLLTLSCWLPSRVLFIRVEGNESVPTRLILEKSEACGIRFGASRRHVRSERIKNELLASIDGLQWVGIITEGCVATVTVRERIRTETEADSIGVCSIVSCMDGVITSCTATAGSLQCSVGQVVKTGDLLISGYTDCGISIRATRAAGEVYAQTRRQQNAVLLTKCSVDGGEQREVEKFALVIGKNRINFYKGSGISGTTCDKIYEENYMTLPGGFRLPVAIVKETWIYADVQEDFMDEEAAESILKDFTAWYLPMQMKAGSVLTAWETVSFTEQSALLQGYYACTEMIGRVKNEEIITPYGNDH